MTIVGDAPGPARIEQISGIAEDEPYPVAANDLQEGLGGQFGEMRSRMHPC